MYSVGMFVVVVGRIEKNHEELFWSPALPLASQGYLVQNVHCDLRCIVAVVSWWISSGQMGRTLTWMRTMK